MRLENPGRVKLLHVALQPIFKTQKDTKILLHVWSSLLYKQLSVSVVQFVQHFNCAAVISPAFDLS